MSTQTLYAPTTTELLADLPKPVTYYDNNNRPYVSVYTHAEAQVIIAGIDTEFAKKLAQTDARLLSSRQIAYLHILAVQVLVGNKATGGASAAATQIDCKTIRLAFLKARTNGLKQPKVKIPFGKGIVAFSTFGSSSKYSGDIKVSDGGDYESGTYYGRIEFGSGNFIASQAGRAPEILEFVAKFAADPEGVIDAAGIKAGACCYCSIELKADPATRLGYGKICAKKWGRIWP